jgi:hypothetical protein
VAATQIRHSHSDGRAYFEEDHKLGKQASGLDARQVIRWKSWHRWTAVSLLAYIYLAVAIALQASTTPAQTWTPG